MAVNDAVRAEGNAKMAILTMIASIIVATTGFLLVLFFPGAIIWRLSKTSSHRCEAGMSLLRKNGDVPLPSHHSGSHPQGTVIPV